MFPRAAPPLGRKGILRGATPRFGCLRFDQRIALVAGGKSERSVFQRCFDRAVVRRQNIRSVFLKGPGAFDPALFEFKRSVAMKRERQFCCFLGSGFVRAVDTAFQFRDIDDDHLTAGFADIARVFRVVDDPRISFRLALDVFRMPEHGEYDGGRTGSPPRS